MSRKKLAPDQVAPKEKTFNKLIQQLEDPESLLNFLPEDARLAAVSLDDRLVNLSEDEVLQALEKAGCTPTPTVEALRNNFWMEYDRVQGNKKERLMSMTNVYFGVCSRDYFNKILNHQPYFFAYILTRSPEYESVQAGMLALATRRVRDILSIPIKKPNGDMQDPKIIELVLKAAAMVDLRNKGGYINRSETKNMTMIEQNTKHTYAGMFNASSNDGVQSAASLQKSIDEQLKQLDMEAAQAPKPPEPKFAASSKDDVVDAEYKEVQSE